MCKNGEIKDTYVKGSNPDIMLYRSHDRFQEFFEKCDNTDDNYVDNDSIYVPYKKLYGCAWKYDHSMFTGEYCIYKFMPDRAGDREFKYMPAYCYERYSGGAGEDETYEGMILDIAGDVLDKYGDFSFDDFLTDAEKKNHADNDMFFMIPEEHENFGMCCRMEDNKNYIHVPGHVINSRWWDWYRKTDHYDEHWKGE